MSVDSLPFVACQTIHDFGQYNSDMVALPLYTQVDLDQSDLQRICDSATREYEQRVLHGKPVAFPPLKPAPNYTFTNQTVRDIFSYHLNELVPNELDAARHHRDGSLIWDPKGFAVANSRQWQHDGLLLVFCQSPQGYADSFQIQVEDVVLASGMLRDQEQDWDQTKDQMIYRSNDPNRRPPWGYHLGVYAVEAVNQSLLMNTLEFESEQRSILDKTCVFSGTIHGHGDADALLRESVDAHISKCRAGDPPYLQPRYFILAPPSDSQSVILVELDRPSASADGTADPIPTYRTQHSPTSNALYTLRSIILARRAWDIKSPDVFGVYFSGGSGEATVIDIWDPDWHEKEEEEFSWMGLDEFGDDGSSNTSGEVWRKILASQPVHVKNNPRLNPRLIIYVDSDNPQEKGVVLGKLTWNGHVGNKSETELRGLLNEQDVEVTRCPIGEALDRLTAVSNGTEPWDGSQLTGL